MRNLIAIMVVISMMRSLRAFSFSSSYSGKQLNHVRSHAAVRNTNNNMFVTTSFINNYFGSATRLYSTTERNIQELESAIKAKGDEIRALKASGAEKAVVTPLVEELLKLKAELNPEDAPSPKKKDKQQQNKQKQKQKKMPQKIELSESELRQTRLAKIDSMIERGVEPYAYSYDRNTNAAKLQIAYGDESKLEPGTEDESADVSIAGRVMAKREFGKLAFYTLQDESGRVQLYLDKKRLGDSFKDLKAWADLGDYIGVRGTIRKTDKGEVSVYAKGKNK